MLGSILPVLNGSLESLVKSAGGVFYYDARKDLITANGVTPDRSGQGNSVTWANFAGSGASGLVAESGKVFRRLDGTDDFGSMVNTASIDVTSAPLAVFATIRATFAQTGYIFVKNGADVSTTRQYGLRFDSAGSINAFLEGLAKSTYTPITLNTWVNVGMLWDGANVKCYCNSLSGTPVTFSGNLTSRANTAIGMIIGGSTFFKGDLSTLTIYAGTKATEANILKTEKAISKAYIGG